MTTREEALSYGLSFPGAYQDAPFHDPNWQLVRTEGNRKVFLWTYERNGFINLNVKVSPEWRDFWRSAYASVVPGWHQNKEHWNTVILDGTVPDEEIRRMIAESYDLTVSTAATRIYEAVKKIPRGKVATYGQVAALAGNSRMARAVGNALHHNPDPDNIPCYRVVNLPPWMEAPIATHSSGFRLLLGSCPVSCLTFSCTAGIRVEPPTRRTLDKSAEVSPASFRAF